MTEPISIHGITIKESNVKLKLKSGLGMAMTLSVCCLITACSSEKNTTASKPGTESVDPSDELKHQIETKSHKAFPATEQDAHDIGLLQDYEKNFNSMSTELENELKELSAQGNLSEEMNNQRKRDLIQSSLNMLKDLDLKTEQGRYIQGLFYQYWDNQAKVYNELQQSASNELKNPTDAVEGMGDYYTAQAQLKQWHSNTAQ